MAKNSRRNLSLLTAILLLGLAGYCWLKILAPHGPAAWLAIEVDLSLEYAYAEFPEKPVRKAVYDAALSMGIAYDPKLPMPRVFILPSKDMEKIFGEEIIAGIYLHHPYMQLKIFVAKQKYDHLTGREIVRGIMRYLSDTYPDEFDIRQIPFLERKMAQAYQAC